ncbi:ATP-binding cassette sub-family A member 3-like isoform X1 [Photinus pyralis]|uniref:ATP-binding cassette sub-family A member 3-like isoform X1 n=1 Tax=Photinus pyralis TaxID=7054 RepID=UPI001267721A|nr:ATP-binding cassette sub-family A member 3-like isoform X1 [Photinus pyralis]XP_031329081.1 ATP-binding cassette sub-family A member 3-like isoform X1 [Photinus pyralis]
MAKSPLYRQLLVVLWKNCMIRKFHWFLTICEILVPVTLFMLVVIMRAKLPDLGKEQVNIPTYNEQHPAEYFYHEKFNHKYKIYYAPTTVFTTRLMQNVQIVFQLSNEAVMGFATVAALNSYYEKHGPDEDGMMMVIFNNLTGDPVPKQLNYVIRPYESHVHWETNTLFSKSQQYIPESGSETYMDTGFMALKMALDTSFLEIASGEKAPVAITMQEFPYPPYKNDKGLSEIFQSFLPAVTVFSFVFLCPSVLKRVIEEKSTGIKELMKMMGLKSWMLWLGWFLHAFFVSALSVFIITLLLKGSLWKVEPAVLEYCSGSVFFCFLLLYTAAGITFLFAISTLCHKPTIGVVIGTALWIWTDSILRTFLGKTVNMKWYKKMFVSLLPNTALYHGYITISLYESREVGVSWNNLFTPPTGGKEDVALGDMFVMLIVGMIFYTLLTFYIDAVNPGPYGLAKPFSFPITYIYDCIFKRNKSSRVIDSGDVEVFREYCKVETAPNLKPGIQIKNLYKTFGKQSVVNGLTLDIYEDQITALLGHNGAGKTTTMSIITGLIGATSGKVLISGKDIKYHMGEIRSSLGLCPQHNLHFSNLTVMQHLIFFGMLKGLSMENAAKEAQILLTRMGIAPKKDTLASSMSGGMKRKLSLAIALIGNSRVVILDEPTSGLDPESRREIWDMLLSLRGSRTILITTHFMEEADVLGDRIAIMDHGRLMCYGTSMFLKKEFGAGYHLSLISDGNKTNNQLNEIKQLVTGIIPKAVLEADSGNYITFVLPHEAKSSFSTLFEKLEGKKAALGISNINLSVTTLEEVFLRVGNMVLKEENKSKPLELGSTKSSSTSCCCRQRLHERLAASTSVRRKGSKKTKLQLWCLFKKRILVAKKKWFIFLCQVVLALVLTFLSVFLGDAVHQMTDSFSSMDFNLTRYGETTVIYGGTDSDGELSKIMQHYDRLVQQQWSATRKTTSVSGEILKEGVANIQFYNQHMVVAAEFNKTSSGQRIVNAMYSNSAIHGAPISFNLIMNAVLKGMVGEEYSIVAGNSPLPVTQGEYVEEASEVEVASLWLLLFPLGMLFLTSTFVLFPHMERVSNIKQLQLMCGIRSFLYWISCYLWDLILYFVTVLLILATVRIYGFVFSKIFSGFNEIGALFVILTAYGFSIIPLAYLFSYKSTAAGAFGAFLMSNLFTSNIMTVIVMVMLLSEEWKKMGVVLKYVLSLSPQFGLTFNSVQFAKKAVRNYNWNIKSAEIRQTVCQFRYNPCCDGDDTPLCIKYKSYFYGDDSMGLSLIIMLFSTVLYFTFLLFLETNIVHRLWDKFLVFIYNQIHRNRKPKGHDELDSAGHEDVFSESKRVYSTLHKEKNENPIYGDETEDLLLVHNLQKVYWGQKVVKGVSFGVKPGDCFGLLGVNGAGKTTTFRMLTGDQPFLDGEARIHSIDDGDVYISKDSKRYLEKVGYCPQFDALNEVLTGREMLRLFAELRGIQEGVEEEINMWLHALGLEEFADNLCGLYSGGNKRKLSIAMALIGSPLLVMLDEPTSGVDPIARRKLWDTIHFIQSQTIKPSIILTSHSMEECEVLCNKLAIMKAGQLECYGTIPKLKEKYGQGYTVMLKLKSCINIVVNHDDTDSTASQSQPLSANSRRDTNLASGDSEEVKNLMLAFENKYKDLCTLRDKHAGLLHYHINDKTKKWSELFKEIEELQRKHTIIEDYNISETSLEEVFLSIARSDPKPAAEIVL